MNNNKVERWKTWREDRALKRRQVTAICPMRQARRRLGWVAGSVTLAFLVAFFRLADVTLFSDIKISKRSISAASYRPERADIVDRNGVILATNVATYSLYANPSKVMNPAEAASKLVQELPELDEKNIRQKLSRKGQFAWLKRNLTPQQRYRVNALGIPGLNFDREERRVYPAGTTAAHLLGYTDVDTNGIAGVEAGLNERLASDPTPVSLSIDVRLQYVLQDALQTHMEKFSAIAAAGLIMDARNSEVLALVSLPDFDPNQLNKASKDALFNRVTLGVYEMGSTLKVVNTALALETGSVTLTDQLDARYPIKIGRHKIDDYRGKKRFLSVPEVILYSSNIASAKMALRAGKERQQAFLQSLGLLTPPHLEIPEIGAPLIPKPWRESDTMTISFGHSLSINALQLSNAMAAIVNGGYLRKPTVIKGANQDTPVYQVVSRSTSNAMRRLLRLNAQIGSAKKADVPGYLLGGKTGTAEKREARGYSKDNRRSSLLSAFPMHDPRYVVWVMLDEPKGIKETYGFATAGWVATPIIRQVVSAMAPLLGILPINEQAPHIQDALALNVDGTLPEQVSGKMPDSGVLTVQ